MLSVGVSSAFAQGGGTTVIECGAPPLEEFYCYSNSDLQTWSYTVSGTGTLRLIFDRGTIESSNWDQLTIYDGTDASGVILFDHTNTTASNLGPPGSAILSTTSPYYAVEVTSATGSLFMAIDTDGSVSCAGGSAYDQWEWRVMCIDCTQPEVSYQVVPDCENFQYSVEVTVATLGSASAVTIGNTLNDDETVANAPGAFVMGPFTSGQEVIITVAHQENYLCDVASGILIDPLCPTFVCGTAPLEQTYCYTPSDDMAWAYQVPAGGQVRLVFDRGTMESSSFDDLRIYDGVDANAPLLFEHTNTNTMHLGPTGSALGGASGGYYAVDVTSTSGNLFMHLTSDGSVQCSGSTTYDPMEWRVMCVGCQAPGVEFEIVPDCQHLQFGALVNITSLNGPSGFQISGYGITLNADSVGSYPIDMMFPLDSTVNFQVVDLNETVCTYESGELMFPVDSCVINSCGIDSYQLCYGNNEDSWFMYSSVTGLPIVITFNYGHMFTGDKITIYNGLEPLQENMLFTGNNGGDLTGLSVNSSGLGNTLTMRIHSDAGGSCASGEAVVDMDWYVTCGFVGIDEVADEDRFTLYPNPATAEVYLRMEINEMQRYTVQVMDLSGRTMLEHASVSGGTRRLGLDGLGNGQYLIRVRTDAWVATRPLQLIR